MGGAANGWNPGFSLSRAALRQHSKRIAFHSLDALARSVARDVANGLVDFRTIFAVIGRRFGFAGTLRFVIIGRAAARLLGNHHCETHVIR